MVNCGVLTTQFGGVKICHDFNIYFGYALDLSSCDPVLSSHLPALPYSVSGSAGSARVRKVPSFEVIFYDAPLIPFFCLFNLYLCRWIWIIGKFCVGRGPGYDFGSTKHG